MKTKHAQSFRVVRFVLSAFCLLMMLVPLPSYGAETGIVKGKIIDKADGEGIFGASVTVAGTTLGTATDMNGNFTLHNIPAKQQKLSVSIVGYTPASQVVTVGAGQTATANFTLGQTTVMASEVVVGAALYKQDRLDVPVTTCVINKDGIREGNCPSLDQVIEDVPGVNIHRSAGYSASGIQIRGSNTYQGGGIGTRVNAFYDGFPVNTPETGGIVLTNINMNSADRVEIIKGAASTLYGSGAMGGVINVYSGLPSKLEVKAGVSGGFYDAPPSSDQSTYRDGYTPWLWNTYVGLGNKSGKWNYSALYTHSQNDGYRENAQTLMNDVKLKLRYDINAKQYVQLTSFYNETEAGYVNTWPFDVGFAFAPTPHFVYTPHPERAYDLTSVYKDDIVKRKDALVGLNYVNLLSDKLSLDARVYYTYNQYRLDYNPTGTAQLFPIFPPGMLSAYTGFIYNKDPGEFNENKTGRIGAGVKLDWRLTDAHRLLFGLEANKVNLTSTQYSAQLVPQGQFGDISEKNVATFLQDEWKVTDKLTALMSLRYDWSGINASEVTYQDWTVLVPPTVTAPIQNQSLDAISPRIALNYKAMDDLAFRASWGKSFRAPTLAERFVRDAGLFMGNPNPALNKETMTAYEFGIYKQLGEKVSVDVAAYVNDYDNLIESANISTIPAQRPVVFHYENIAKARIWGIETSLNFRPSDVLSFNLGYSYMNAINKSYVKGAKPSIDNNPDPEWLTYRPEHTASLSATWNATKKLALNGSGRYVSKIKAVSTDYSINPDGYLYPGGFIVLNAGAKYKATENIGLTLFCNNITNEQYEEVDWFRAPGRNYVAGVDFTF